MNLGMGQLPWMQGGGMGGINRSGPSTPPPIPGIDNPMSPAPGSFMEQALKLSGVPGLLAQPGAPQKQAPMGPPPQQQMPPQMMNGPLSRDQLNNLYMQIFGRQGDPGGLDFHTGKTQQEFINAALGSDEYRQKLQQGLIQPYGQAPMSQMPPPMMNLGMGGRFAWM